MGKVVLICRLTARDLRRRPVEALMVFLVIAAAATTLTVALALSGVTSKMAASNWLMIAKDFPLIRRKSYVRRKFFAILGARHSG